jgi:hypothetical protein
MAHNLISLVFSVDVVHHVGDRQVYFREVALHDGSVSAANASDGGLVVKIILPMSPL